MSKKIFALETKDSHVRIWFFGIKFRFLKPSIRKQRKVLENKYKGEEIRNIPKALTANGIINPINPAKLLTLSTKFNFKVIK